MKVLKHLFENNLKWAAGQIKDDAEFFKRLSQQQKPEYLWIGCSDSRVPANQIVGLPPGEVFVHRNVANLVVENDLNCLSVIQFAVEALKVKHIIVCGHYGCGGVKTVMEDKKLGLIDNWLKNIHTIKEKNNSELSKIEDQLSNKSSTISKQAILILAALNIANEYMQCKQRHTDLLETVSDRASNLLNELTTNQT